MIQEDKKEHRRLESANIWGIYLGIIVAIFSPVFTYYVIEKPRFEFEIKQFKEGLELRALTQDIAYINKIVGLTPKFSAEIIGKKIDTPEKLYEKPFYNLPFLIKNDGDYPISIRLDEVQVITGGELEPIHLKNDHDYFLYLSQANNGESFELPSNASAELIIKLRVNTLSEVNNNLRFKVSWKAEVGGLVQGVAKDLVKDTKAKEFIQTISNISEYDSGWLLKK